MAECAYCKAETHLYISNVPVCIACADPRRRASPVKNVAAEGENSEALIKSLKEATERADAASMEFDAVMCEIPSGIPHPDGVQRIHNASRALSDARAQMMKAHIRLNEFFGRAIGPEDLKSNE